MILYEDDNIAAIATFGSSNTKTGSMAQLWVLYRHEAPTEASKTGNDSFVCGECPHKPSLAGSCYVNLGQAPNNVYRKYKNGGYPQGTPKELMAEDIRFGAYGDPAFLPFALVHALAKYANSWTGYTHQWKTCDPRFSKYFMASVDTEEEYKLAKVMGWKTFRTVLSGDQLELSERICPSNVVTCKQCKKCNTQNTDIAIEVHGTSAKISNYIHKLRGIPIELTTIAA